MTSLELQSENFKTLYFSFCVEGCKPVKLHSKTFLITSKIENFSVLKKRIPLKLSINTNFIISWQRKKKIGKIIGRETWLLYSKLFENIRIILVWRGTTHRFQTNLLFQKRWRCLANIRNLRMDLQQRLSKLCTYDALLHCG